MHRKPRSDGAIDVPVLIGRDNLLALADRADERCPGGSGGFMELDGRPIEPEELATLALYNYGHFTSMRVEDMCVRGLTLHLERLARDCKVVYDAPLDQERVRHLVARVAQRAPSPIIARVTIFAPDLELGHPGADAEPHVLVTTRQAPTQALPPLRLHAVRYDRDLSAVKHVGLFGAVYHRREAQRQGFDDVLFTTADSRIAEGATWNIGLLDGGRVVWPEADCLPGVTMRLVQDGLPKLAMQSVSAPVHLTELNRMQGAFITNAGVGVRRISSIDDVAFAADASAVDALQAAYLAIPGEAL
jgi:branched-subunit amino acid aminotransferase/4-amino-4-deoxychorismate lyase